MKLRPIHFWMGTIGSAFLGAAIVIVAVVLIGRHKGFFDDPPSPAANGPLTGAPGGGRSVSDLVAPSSDLSKDDDDTTQPGASKGGGLRSKSKGRPAQTEKSLEAHNGKAAAVKELTTNDVLAGVKENVPKLGPCLEAARKKNEMAAGKHTLVMSFTVTPNGTVKGGKLEGPDYLLKTSLSGCVATKMHGWRFPASAAGATIKSFLLPINLK